jgi:TolB-like protein/Tfp pilus assembly protein PilF
MNKFIEELKRRNVIKSALAYLVVSWVITQVATTILPTFGAPAFVTKTIIFILAIGFPLWLIFSWVYEITEKGIKKTVNIEPEESITPQTNNRLNKIIIGALAIAIALLLVNHFGNRSENRIVSDNEIDKTEKSIAVLAFADMSPQKDQEYLSDGMSAEFISILGKTKGLKVRDRRSSFTFKNKDATIEQIGEQLKVRYVIDGSVRKYGDKLKVDVQIINASDGSYIWTESFDYTMDNIFKMQDDIAKVIVAKLKISLGIEEISNERGTNSIEAYENVLKGKHLYNMNFHRSNLTSDKLKSLFYDIEKLFKKAIEIDSTYADAHAHLADLYDTGIDIFANDSIFKIKSENEMDIAYGLNPNSGIVNYVKSLIYNRNNDQDNTHAFLIKALEIDPQNLTIAYDQLATSLMLYGLYDEARLLFIKYLEYDPINILILRRIGYVNQLMGRFDAAEKYYKELQLLGYENSYFLLCRLYCLKKEIPKAEEYLELFLKNDNTSLNSEKTLKAYLLAAKEDQQALEFLRSQEILLMLGNYDEWFEYMELFFNNNPMRCYYHQLTIDPNVTKGMHQEYLNLFLPLRNYAKYNRLLKEQGLRYENNYKRFSLKNSILKNM